MIGEAASALKQGRYPPLVDDEGPGLLAVRHATVLHGVFCCTQPQRRDLIAKKTSLSQVVERKREGFEAAVSHR
jgi:hypothetical protein